MAKIMFAVTIACCIICIIAMTVLATIHEWGAAALGLPVLAANVTCVLIWATKIWGQHKS